MNFYDELKKIMIALAQVEGDSEIISINVRAGKHTYRINAQFEVEEVDKNERRNIMSTLELLQLKNEHKTNTFLEKGEDETEEQEGEDETEEQEGE